MHPHGYPHHEGNPLKYTPPQPYPYYPHSTYTYPTPTYHYPPPNPYPFPHHYLPPPNPYPSYMHSHHPPPYAHWPPPYQKEFPHQSPILQEDSLSSKALFQSVESKLVQMMQKIDPSYTHEPYSFPNSHPNTYYPPPSQCNEGNTASTSMKHHPPPHILPLPILVITSHRPRMRLRF